MLWLGRQPSLGEGVSHLSSGLNYVDEVDVSITGLLIVSLTNTHNLINDYLCYSIRWYNGSMVITLPFFSMPRS